MKKKQGQALVEWALIVPVMLMLTFSVCQWCLIQLHQNLVNHAAWQAARAQAVWENPFDAAAITLLPVAGFSKTLKAQISDEGELIDLISTSTDGSIALPGWSEFSRGSMIQDRLQVNVLEDDWDKATCEVTFRSELLFPFVEFLFTDSKKKYDALNLDSPQSVTQDNVSIGFANRIDNFKDEFTTIKAKNFVDLKAQATAVRIDQPLSAVDFGDWDGGPAYDSDYDLFIQRSQTNWTREQ